MKKYLSTLTLIFVSIAAFSQSTVNPKTKFVGKWLLVKHTFTEKGKTEDLLTANEVYTYDFAANGTYAVSYTDKKKESTTVYKGKWQVIGGGKKIRLYDNVLPTEPGRLVSDNLLPIISISATQFVTKELLFGMDLMGTSYYKRQ